MYIYTVQPRRIFSARTNESSR